MKPDLSKAKSYTKNLLPINQMVINIIAGSVFLWVFLEVGFSILLNLHGQYSGILSDRKQPFVGFSYGLREWCGFHNWHLD